MESGIAYDASRCIRMTLLCASRFSAYFSYGPTAWATLADCRYARPVISAVIAAAVPRPASESYGMPSAIR